MFDGHSIDLVGFHEGKEFPGGGYFIFRNSFGPQLSITYDLGSGNGVCGFG